MFNDLKIYQHYIASEKWQIRLLTHDDRIDLGVRDELRSMHMLMTIDQTQDLIADLCHWRNTLIARMARPKKRPPLPRLIDYLEGRWQRLLEKVMGVYDEG